MKRGQHKQGFTIVELLIVIVVIGILAAVTVTAYSNIRSRTNLAKVNQELASIQKGILMYFSENGSYPDTANGWRGYVGYGAHGQNFVPGIAPQYVSKVPGPSVLSANSDYLYRSNGSDYKLIAHDSNTGSGGFYALCPLAVQMNPQMADSSRNCWAWGYWSTGGAGF